MEWTLWWAAGGAGLACLTHAMARIRARKRVGEILCSSVGARGWRLVYRCAVAGVLVWTLLLGVLPWLPVALLFLLSALVVTLSFPSGDQACGALGVRSGSWAFSYSELEEWRLTGEHLRFRHGGVWRAVRVPGPLQVALRSRLEAAVGDTESRFKR